jgi:hypothetical protein
LGKGGIDGKNGVDLPFPLMGSDPVIIPQQNVKNRNKPLYIASFGTKPHKKFGD